MEQNESTISCDEKKGENRMENEGATMRKTFNAIDEVKRKIDELDDIWCEIENSGQIPIGHKYRGFMRQIDLLVYSTQNAIQECVDAANEMGIERTGESE